jgi:hypothetical protein
MKSPKQIIAYLKRMTSSLSSLDEKLAGIDEKFDQLKMNQGLMLSMLKEGRNSKNLHDHEFKVFSQWGEDGIIQRLSKIVAIKNKTFIEFGVESFFEANCRFLLMKDNWSGFVIDGSSENIERLKKAYFYWQYHIDAIDAFITRENIDALLSKSGFDGDLGILSVDLDGNDYYVLEAISVFKPRILICEYNAVFGATRKISIPYDPAFNRTKKHNSNLYWGASLAAITHLANKKNYSLVGTNSTGSNAFYVRNDLLTEQVEVLSSEEAYFPSKFRESRDAHGNLTYVTENDRLRLIQGLPVFNVEMNTGEVL